MGPPGVSHPVKFKVDMEMVHQQKLPAHPRQNLHYPHQLLKLETMFLPKILKWIELDLCSIISHGSFLSCWNNLFIYYINLYHPTIIPSRFNPWPMPIFAKVTRRVLTMLQKGMIDAATAREILGKLPEETSGCKEGGQKRPLEKDLGHGGTSTPDSDEFERCLDELVQESKKQKLETLLQEQFVCFPPALLIFLYLGEMVTCISNLFGCQVFSFSILHR